MASGDVDGAIFAYKKALEIDPDEQYANSYLMRLGRALNDFPKYPYTNV